MKIQKQILLLNDCRARYVPESLRARTEGRVAVVGHSGVMERLLGSFPGNCEVIEKEL